MSLEIYEINTLNWLNELSIKHGKKINLNNIPDNEIKDIQDLGFNAVWLMGVWQRSPKALEINKNDPIFMSEVNTLLPKDRLAHLVGSAYSIKDYSLNPVLGVWQDLLDFKKLLNERNIKLILDFVPNHVALDHVWTKKYPEYFIKATDEVAASQSNNFTNIEGHNYALGRDPHYEPWVDVVQLNAFSENLRHEAASVLKNISSVADGVRCDMAMLFLNQIFSSTWGKLAGDIPNTEYWQSVISEVREVCPELIFIAEAYWHSGEKLVSLGFNYVYDKDFYDCLWSENYDFLRLYLSRPLSEQHSSLRFIENHDEPRAASHVFKVHRMAAAILVTTPGAHLFYHGQLSGKKIKMPVQLSMDSKENKNKKVSSFYRELFVAKENVGDPSNRFELLLIEPQYEDVLCWRWEYNESVFITAVNYNNRLQNFRVDLIKKPRKAELIFSTSKKIRRLVELNDDGLWISLAPHQVIILKINLYL